MEYSSTASRAQDKGSIEVEYEEKSLVHAGDTAKDEGWADRVKMAPEPGRPCRRLARDLQGLLIQPRDYKVRNLLFLFRDSRWWRRMATEKGTPTETDTE